MVTILAKVNALFILWKDQMRAGGVTGNTESIQTPETTPIKFGWKKNSTNLGGKGRLRTSFHPLLIFTMDPRVWHIIQGQHWVQHGRISFSSLNLWGIQAGRTSGHLVLNRRELLSNSQRIKTS